MLSLSRRSSASRYSSMGRRAFMAATRKQVSSISLPARITRVVKCPSSMGSPAGRAVVRWKSTAQRWAWVVSRMTATISCLRGAGKTKKRCLPRIGTSPRRETFRLSSPAVRHPAGGSKGSTFRGCRQRLTRRVPPIRLDSPRPDMAILAWIILAAAQESTCSRWSEVGPCAHPAQVRIAISIRRRSSACFRPAAIPMCSARSLSS